jgi:hypothetical protein
MYCLIFKVGNEYSYTSTPPLGPWWPVMGWPLPYLTFSFHLHVILLQINVLFLIFRFTYKCLVNVKYFSTLQIQNPVVEGSIASKGEISVSLLLSFMHTICDQGWCLTSKYPYLRNKKCRGGGNRSVSKVQFTFLPLHPPRSGWASLNTSLKVVAKREVPEDGCILR